MANGFESFDKSRVLNDAAVRKYCGLTLKEILLVAVIAVLLALCFVLLALYATKGTDEKPYSVENDVCFTKECMEAASYSMQMMNDSIDPCDNFFLYACGNFKMNHPSVGEGRRTVMRDLDHFNEARLEELILKGFSFERPEHKEDAYDRKLYNFVNSCRFNRYQYLNRYQYKEPGAKIEDRIVPKLGGWDLMGNWDEENWDFNTIFQKVQSDYMVDALFSIKVIFNKSESYIEINPSLIDWMGIRNYSIELGSLMLRDARDANVTKEEGEKKVEQFANDTALMVDKMFDYPEPIPYHILRSELFQQKLITVKEATEHTRGVIDWLGLLSYKFRPASITNGTKVLVVKAYLRKMADTIENLPNDERKRILHNFLMFSVFDFYVQAMSVEYMMAKLRQYPYGGPRVTGLRNLDNYCMDMVRRYMKDALGALYIKRYFDHRGKQQAKEIVLHLQKALKSVVDQTPWMDGMTKKYAKSKLDSISYKIGYPDWMEDDELVDAKYKNFGGPGFQRYADFLLDGNKFLRLSYAKELMAKDNKEEWIPAVYDTKARLVWYRNELVVTAGLLQKPIYDVDAPLYKTFGSLGTILGRFLHHVVDSYGEYTNKYGGFTNKYGERKSEEDQSWWSDQSVRKYKEVQKCVKESYHNVFRTMHHYSGTITKIPMRADVPIATATTSGIRLALKGYRDWTRSREISEKPLPSLGLTTEQLFFLSYAQNWCSTESGDEQGITKVNVPLGQLQEFSDAFQCKPKTKMNPEKKCPYY